VDFACDAMACPSQALPFVKRKPCWFTWPAAVTHYYRALDQSIKATFTAGQIAYLKAALEAEQAHLDVLKASGGKALLDKFFFPAGDVRQR
jgi:hypothetical protein